MVHSLIPVSAVVLAKNAEVTIGKVVSALHPVVGEVLVVVDDASTDATTDHAIRQGARVIHRPWKGFGNMRNWAQQQAQFDWILMIDADEIPDDQLLNSLRAQQWTDPHQVFWVNRLNYYIGVPMKCCGLYPDWKPRIYHRSIGRWTTHAVHELLEVPVKARRIRLQGHLHHHFANSIDMHLSKARMYAQLRAYDWLSAGRTYSSWNTIGHAVRKFLTLYFLKGGWRWGWRGLAYCAIMGLDRLLRHLYLAAAKEASPKWENKQA